MIRTMLWWGRFDPDYSRNRILRNLLKKNEITIRDFRPRSSYFGTLESRLHPPEPSDAVWVPCFRHRDLISARRFADRTGAPLVFDPLISSWDKIVHERAKYPADHPRAMKLLNKEQSLFSRADYVVADTGLHSRFFIEQLCAPADRTLVIPVGAEESLFSPQPPRVPSTPIEILFFGSFISLQGPHYIVEAARMLPEVRWTLLGDGPLKERCRELADGLSQVRFEDWLPYEQLAKRIGAADIVLGIFGDSAKAGRVIPNKVYQALACGRPVITRQTNAYPIEVRTGHSSGMILVPPADPAALADAVNDLLSQKKSLPLICERAARTYNAWLGETKVHDGLFELLLKLSR